MNQSYGQIGIQDSNLMQSSYSIGSFERRGTSSYSMIGYAP